MYVDIRHSTLDIRHSIIRPTYILSTKYTEYTELALRIFPRKRYKD